MKSFINHVLLGCLLAWALLMTSSAGASPRPFRGPKLIHVDGGTFQMGSNDHEATKEEGPARMTEVGSYFLDETEVSHKDFSTFVQETGHKTDSEKYGWSFVFHRWVPEKLLIDVSRVVKGAEWWIHVNRASFREPFGPGTKPDSDDHPAIHISWNDAKAFCKWAGKRLPTEKEWEFAAREGKNSRFPWGDEPDVKRYNAWQGAFPMKNDKTDGYEKTAPVKSFPPNELGFYNLLGNVWEWTADDFTHGKKSQRGGSYIDSLTGRFNHRVSPSARTGNTPESASDNTGFRCATDDANGQPVNLLDVPEPTPPTPLGAPAGKAQQKQQQQQQKKKHVADEL